MSQEEESAYDNTHRAFLQVFLARSTLTLAEAKPVLAAITSASQPADRPVLEGDITETDVNNYVAAINAAVSPFDIEIRSTFTQGPGPRRRLWALVNITSDAITQLATTHSPDEIAFVKRMLDQMFDKNNTTRAEIMALTSMQALGLNKVSASDRSSGAGRMNIDDDVASTQTPARSSAQSITVTQAQNMLKSMVDEEWFEKEGGHYTLSTRALVELRGWLLETYNEPDDDDGEGGIERIKLCNACTEIVTSGQRCANRSCKVRLHDHCADGVWRLQRDKTCPKCKTQWTGQDFVGVRAVKDSGRRRPSGNQTAVVADDDVDDDDEN